MNDFLPLAARSAPLEIARPPQAVVALIQDLGVPHTEVDLILVNGSSVGLDHQVVDGDFVSVYPVFESFDISTVTRVRPAPLRQSRFLLDAHLGRLARLLRMMGFDTAYERSASDHHLALRAHDEERVLLTQDRGLLKRRLVTHGYCVRSHEPEAQAREVLRRFDLAALARPFSRCLVCNGPLEPLRQPTNAVPELARSSQTDFQRCPRCLRTYWRGSHWKGMKKTAARLLVRSLAR